MNPFVERHQEQIAGVLECFDRLIITGTLPEICHGEALAHYLSSRGIRLFDYPHWAEPLRHELRAHAQGLATEVGLEIEFIRRHDAFRKEKRIKAILTERGFHPGLVHIFSAMEACTAFRAWHDKTQQQTQQKPTQGKCLHYYFYLIDELFGLCYVRVPTWAPCRLQVYFNGHQWLARQLEKAHIGFALADIMPSSLWRTPRARKPLPSASISKPCIAASIVGHTRSARSIKLVRWEDMAPQIGPKAQAVINKQIGDYHLFCGLMWNRFGTPTEIAASGTKEEFDAAVQGWEKSGRPWIAFYFCERPVNFTTPEQLEQKRLVLEFRGELNSKGVVRAFQAATEFEDLLYEDLKRITAMSDFLRLLDAG